MRIKHLKIRNIASIESGDIDFESGLLDKESGLPASLFLITGDTGSGKSVILDCISMALYGTTPRVKSVSDVKNNSYRNNDGEEISVNNIRQYTRIGISWKDDCFTELSFTGNDGTDYVSRFSLGRTSRRNYRDPAWVLTIDGSTTIEKKDDIRERIQKAVGLTFEQFSRMAMLAQGQFATFLTGKKEERERILEQLTATDVFSRYGEAIANIFKKSRQEKELSAKLFEEFGKKILTDEQRRDLLSEQKEKTIRSAEDNSKAERLRRRIEDTEALLKAEKEIARLSAEAAKLKETEETPDFRKRTANLNLWDDTSSQRELLSEKIKASEKITTDKTSLQEKKSEFIQMSAVLSSYKKASSLLSERLKRDRIWIEGQVSRKQLYSDSTAVIERIDHFLSLGKETVRKEKEYKDTEANLSTLKETNRLLEKDVAEKAGKCADCHALITRKSAERDSLKPTELRTENDRLSKRKFALEELSRLLESYDSDKKESEKAEKDTSELIVRNARLKEDADNATVKCSRIEKEKNEAESRYVTMHLSVEKNFKEIRRRLAEEHASNCPLCGQALTDHLREWNNEDYFSGILSPLGEEKKKLEEAYALAKKEAEDKAMRLNTSIGSLNARQNELKKRKNKVLKIKKDIKEKLNALSIEYTEELSTVVAGELLKLKAEIKTILERLSEAEKLQKEIDALLKQKETLDKDQKSAEQLLQKSTETLIEKKGKLRSVESRIKELLTETDVLKEALNNTLKGYVDNWMADPKATACKLKEDADTYTASVARYSKEETEYRVSHKILESLSEIDRKLSTLFESIEEAESRSNDNILENIEIGDLQEIWQSFSIDAATISNRISDNERRVSELNRELNEYYLASGKSETTLKDLLGMTDQITSMRRELEKHNAAIQGNSTLMAENIKNRNDKLKSLEIEDSAHIEDIESLRKELKEIDDANRELTQRLGAIKEKLDTDEKTQRESELQRADLELKTLRYEKWEKMNKYFGGTKFRTLVQSNILRPLLDNANIYLRQITDHYTLTCSDENEQLSILVLDRYHNNEPRSVTVLSGGERFMISLALSLALSAMNRPDLNVDILFIDEGFGTLDAKSLEMVMTTLRRLPLINGQTGSRVGVI